MSLARIEIMYGHLEAVNFARDPTAYLSIEAGIFRKRGLEVSLRHVQGTEERYRRLESGAADISFVVGRASLKHFLDTKTTRIIGSSMNTCPYYLVVNPVVGKISDLKGQSLACKKSPARGSRLAEVFQEKAGLRLDADVELKLPKGDQDAFHMLINGEVAAALVPRPYCYFAEEKGFKRIGEWPDVVDDPLPVTIETTTTLLSEKEKEFSDFLEAHREGVRFLQSHRDETLRMLGAQFGFSPALAAKTFDDYLVCLDERLTVDFKQLEKLLNQVAPNTLGGARKVASEWVLPWALTV